LGKGKNYKKITTFAFAEKQITYWAFNIIPNRNLVNFKQDAGNKQNASSLHNGGGEVCLFILLGLPEPLFG
jgi:hypothetical protein